MKMPRSREATTKALLDADTISMDGVDYLVARTGRFPVRLSVSMLEAVDTRLPEALEYIFKVLRHNEVKTLKRTLAHWTSPMAPAGAGYYFMRPIKIKVLAGDGSAERLFEITANQHKAIVVREALELIGGSNGASSHQVSETWLKQYYPDILTKFDVLSALGYKPKEISKMAVATTPITAARVDTSTLNFD